MKFARLASKIFNTPLLLEPVKARTILRVLSPRMGFGISEFRAGDRAIVLNNPDEGIFENEHASAIPYTGYCIQNGVARIPVIGTLVHRTSGMDAESGLVSYVDIGASYDAALEDEAVNAIAIEVDSGGGEKNGAFDLADKIFAGRGKKPVVAIAADWMCSGAFLIGAAADRVITTQTGEVGSVGVFYTHVDYSEQNRMLGEAVTYIYAGAHKLDGVPDKPLSPEAKERFQASVDKTYRLFVDAIARYRGMSAEAVIATQADVYDGADAVAAGFADEVSTVDEALERLADEARPSIQMPGATIGAVTAQTSEQVMTTKPTAPAAPVEPAALAAPPTAPVADVPAVDTAAISAQATSAERTRVAAILNCEDASGRDELARHLAFDTAMSADDAKKLLAKSPKQVAAAAPTDRLGAAMTALGNPDVGADAGQGGDDDADAVAKGIVAVHRNVNGRDLQHKGN